MNDSRACRWCRGALSVDPGVHEGIAPLTSAPRRPLVTHPESSASSMPDMLARAWSGMLHACLCSQHSTWRFLESELTFSLLPVVPSSRSKLVFRKYDPVVKKHVLFEESKMR
jgi:hypothetical protein